MFDSKTTEITLLQFGIAILSGLAKLNLDLHETVVLGDTIGAAE